MIGALARGAAVAGLLAVLAWLVVPDPLALTRAAAEFVGSSVAAGLLLIAAMILVCLAPGAMILAILALRSRPLWTGEACVVGAVVAWLVLPWCWEACVPFAAAGSIAAGLLAVGEAAVRGFRPHLAVLACVLWVALAEVAFGVALYLAFLVASSG